METNKHMVRDYNMGTLIRIDSREEFGPQNSVVVPRLQFYCIEIARNRKGFNAKFVASKNPKK